MVRRGNALAFQSVISAIIVFCLLADGLRGSVVLENDLAAALFVYMIKTRHSAAVCVTESLRGVVDVVLLNLLEISHSGR